MLLLFKAGIITDRELLELSEANFTDIQNDLVTKELSVVETIVLRLKLAAIY